MKTPQKDSIMFSWRDLCRAYWFLLNNFRWRWLLLMLFLFLIHFYVVVPPLLIGGIVDFFTSYVPGHSLTSFYLSTAILGGSFVIVSFLRLSTKNVLGNLQSEVLYQAKVNGFEKLLDFSLAWHLEESAGAKAQKIKNGVDGYKTLHQKLTNQIMSSVASLVGTIGVFIFLRPTYIVFFLLYALGFYAILRWFYYRIQRENDSYFSSIESAGGSYVEGLSNILTIKTLGASSDFQKHIASKEYRTKDHEFVIRNLYNNLWKSFQAFNGVCYGAFLFLVGYDVVGGLITPGALVVFYGYLQNLIGNAAEMIDTYEVTLSAKAALGRMMSIFWAKTSTQAGTRMVPKQWSDISLNHVSFHYKKEGQNLTAGTQHREAMKDVTLTVPRYAKIGVVGKTGSGKSTFAKILAGLYPITSGSYRIGGVSFYDFTHQEQTTNITLVLQETEVFNLSMRDNITLLRQVDESIIQHALAVSQLEEVVAKLPNGLDTLVGEKGYHLSGGERQRVGIARAICKNSPIIILDEATSSLDSKTESLIQRGLEEHLKDKTIISIAHRVSTLKKTDIIYVFEDGKIVESGAFGELSKDNHTKFSQLSQDQR